MFRPRQPRNVLQLYTRGCRRIPCPVGYNYWRHEVLACGPALATSAFEHTRLSNGKLATLQEFERLFDIDRAGGLAGLIRNSWNNWGDFGFAILTEPKYTPDDCQAPRAVLAA